MPTTRSASRGGSANTTPSSSPQAKSGGAGTKRKAEGTPSKAKREKVDDEAKKQTKIEDMLNATDQHEDKDVDMTTEETSPKEKPSEQPEAEKDIQAKSSNGEHSKSQPPAAEQQKDTQQASKDDEAPESNGQAEEHGKQDKKDAQDVKDEKDEKAQNGTEDQKPKTEAEASEKTDGASAVQTDESLAQAEPSNILEKGLIYFFFRARVNVDDPGSVDDVQRSYIILRPLPAGARLAAGPVPSAGKARILALPKKVLPRSPRDRFLCWVEAAEASFDDIRKQHLARDEYTTRTAGARHTPAAQPAAEGVYAITATGRESHLAYVLTVPEAPGALQDELGLAERGAFVTSVKNPETGAPTGTAPEAKADYSQDIMDDFRGLRWGRLEPRHLDYKDCQFLLIGEHEDGKLEKSVNPEEGDGTKEGKEEPVEVIEQLEKEDSERVHGLKGDASEAVFKDLGLSKEEYSKIKTSWD